MAKWKKILSILLLMSGLLTGRAYAQSETNPVDIWVNGTEQAFSHAVSVNEEGRFFAPMAEFFQKMGIQYNVSGDGEVIAFRDNIFLKLRPNHTTFAVNGKEFTWDRMPTYQGTTLYISLTPFLRYTDIRALYDEEANRLDLSSGSLLEQRRSRGLLKRVEMPGSQLFLSVPYFWERTGMTSFALSPKVGKLSFQVTFDHFDLAGSLRERIEAERAEHAVPEGYRLTESRELLIGNNSFYTRRYVGIPVESPSLQHDGLPSYPYLSVTYFRIGEMFYTFTFEGEQEDIDSQVEVELQILHSVQSKIFSVDSLSEHYVEFGLFKALDVFIESPLYSNMMVRGEFPLKGSIHPDVAYLEVTLLRGERSFQYTVPVTDGSFDERIPVPFGLGFHRMILSAPASQVTLENTTALQFGEAASLLVKCSLINLSEQESLYLSPSKEVLSRDPRIAEAARAVENAGIDYLKAKLLLENMEGVYAPGEASTMAEALETGAGDDYALSLIYTALLRAAQVPARVVRSSEAEPHYVEFYSNGQWIPADPAGFLSSSTSEVTRYFHLRRFEQKKAVPLDL